MRSSSLRRCSARHDASCAVENLNVGDGEKTSEPLDAAWKGAGSSFSDAPACTATMPCAAQKPPDSNKALTSVPPNQRSKVKDVTVEPTGQTYRGDEVGGDSQNGHVHLYPLDEQQDQGDYDTRMHHETGHAVAESVWTDNPQAYKTWQE